MKVLITGGAGFIGSHLCQRFLAENAEVICVDNFSSGRRANLAPLLARANFTLIDHDVTLKLEATKHPCLDRLDLIVHLASPASPRDYLRMPLETALVNSTGTHSLLELAVNQRSRFILASTSEIYGNPDVSPQPEAYWGHVHTLGPRSCYDEGKRFAEMLTMLYHRQFNLDIRIARIFNTYGPGMRASDGRVISNFINQALTGTDLTISGLGSQTRSFCYISDTVEGLYRLTVTPQINGAVVNLGNPNEKTILEIAELILRLCHSSSRYRFTDLPQDDPERRCPDIAKALQLLDWQPKVSLRQGLRKTISYFKKNSG